MERAGAAVDNSSAREAPQQTLERAALAVAGLACAVYLLHSLPAILFPSGLLASALTLLAGVLLGLGAAAGALTLAFWRLTHPKPSRPSVGHAAEPLVPRSPVGRARLSARAGGVSAAVSAVGGVPPAAIAVSGEFSGVVFTAPASQWRRADTVAQWPPTADAAGPFRAWEASLAAGTLVLRPIVPPPGAKPPSPQSKEKGDKGGKGGKDGGSRASSSGSGVKEGSEPAQGGLPVAAGTAAAAGEVSSHLPLPAKVGIPLEGCTVELVVDGLNGRSDLIRRAPLLVSHPKWPLLDGEQAFFLWADEPSAKQQWLHALGWWCQDGEKLAAIQAMYAAYCEAMRDRSILDYPEHVPRWGAGATYPASAPAGAGPGGGGVSGAAGLEQMAGGEAKASKRGWKGWGSSKLQKIKSKHQERKRGSGSGSHDGSVAAGVPSLPAPATQQAGALQPLGLGASPASPAALMAPPGTAEHSPQPVGQAALASAAAALSSEAMSLESIIEAKWMQSRKIKVPPAIAEAVVHSSSRHGSAPTSPRGTTRAAWQPHTSEPGSSTSGPPINGGSAAGSLGSEGFTTPAGGSPVAPWRSPVGRLESSPARLGALPPGSPLRRPLVPPGQEAAGEEGGSQAGEGEGAGGTAAAAAPVSQPGLGLPEGLPPLINPDYAVNAFLTRVLFDLLRRPDFQEHVRVRIQRQLSRIQRPDYIQTLEVVSVDCGGAAPTVRGLRALPQPSSAIWPQLLFDMRYQGAFTVTIEAKVDIRDAAAWEKFDAALSRFGEGKKRRSSAGARSGQQPPHASSAPALGGSGSSGVLALEEDEEDLEPLSPDSSAGALGGSVSEHSGGSPKAEGPIGAEGSSSSSGSQAPERRGFMGGLRQGLAKRVRQLAETTAVHIARIPLRLSVTFSLLEGTMVAWVPPPPGSRLFYSFVAPPRLELSAKPELAGRLLKYSYHIARVSSWIEQRMRAAITKTMVFPGGGDLLLLPLMGLEHPNAGDPLPALGRYMQQAAAVAQQQREEQQREEQQREEQQREEQQREEQQRAASRAEQQQRFQAAALGGEQQERHQSAVVEQPQAVDRQAEVAEPQQPPAQEQQVQAAQPAAAALDAQLAAAAASASAAAAEPHSQPAAHSTSEAAEDWSESQEALVQEPSLTSLPSPQQVAVAAAARDAAAGAAAAGHPGLAGARSGAAAATSNGHLISQRYRSGSEGGERVTSPGFQGWPAASAPGAAERRTSGGRSAGDAWDAAMAREAAGSTREAPTPKFGTGWRSAPGSAGGQRASVDTARADSLPADPLGALQQQRQRQQDAAAAQPSDPLPVPVPLPGLQLRLAATRSLEPDFTTSAERTGFGESPVEALPDYSSANVRRVLSAAPRAAGGSALHHGSADSTQSVGASLNRSLEYLRRQSISSAPGSPALRQQQQHDAGNLIAPSHGPQQPPGPPAADSLPQQQAVGSPPQDTDSSPNGSGRMRQNGSLKDQAGKLFTRMNTAGKALASQVQQMQQQRAAQRAAAQAAGGSVRPSASAEAPSPLRDGL